jgi:predicted nucleotidyltransferase
MPLPDFNEFGDLPEGVYQASFEEVVARFGAGSDQRRAVTDRLRRIVELAVGTGSLDRLIVFGSYVSDALAPNDVDVILIMRDEFRPEDCPTESLPLFDHRRAERDLGASVFWVRPGMLFGEPIDRFIAHWQITRDGRRRGLVEVMA